MAEPNPWSDAPTDMAHGRDPKVSRALEEAQPTLVAYAGEAQGKIFILYPGDTVMGRSTTVTLPIFDDQASRRHCRIHIPPSPEGIPTLEDLGSTNGTFLNGAPVLMATALTAGDRIAIGGHLFRYVNMDPIERSFHQELVALGTLDPLTGLPNRRAIFGELHKALDLARRHHRPLSVILCDLDHFKRVNDELGHPAGDEVLKTFSARIRSVLRDSDTAGRIGGEEFLVVLPETDLAGASLLADRIRLAFSGTPIPLASGPRTVTCSLGFGCLKDSDADGGALVARVDGALYQAKGEGRNRACEA